jgi:hypothetical protein
MQEDAFEGPSSEDEQVEAVDSAPEGTSATDDFGVTYDINAFPEEYREQVQALERDFKGQYTRKTQELAQQRQEWETSHDNWTKLNTDSEFQEQLLRELMELHGYEVEDDEPVDPGYEDDIAEMFHDPRLDEFLSAIQDQHAQQEQEAQIEALTEHVETSIADYEKQVGELDDSEKALIVNQAVQLGLNQEGKLRVDEAIALHQQAVTAANARYRKTKNAPAIGHGTQGEAVHEFDPTDRQARMEVARSMLERPPQS